MCCCSSFQNVLSCPSETVLSAGRFSGVDKEPRHVTKQPANMKERVSDTIQLLSGHHIPDEMGCVTCDWCDVLMRGSWEELFPFFRGLLPCLAKIHDVLGSCSMWRNVAVLVDWLSSPLLPWCDLIWLLRSA